LGRNGGKKEAIINALLELTRGDEYKNGNRLPPERELAKRFDVGRNILREAMVSLEAMGIIEKRERQGIFVKSSEAGEIMQDLQRIQLPPIELMQMQMEVRMMLCVPALKLAALRRSDEDVEKLWRCYEEFSKYAADPVGSEAASGKWEALLHHLETEAAHNVLISRINENIAGLVERNNIFVHQKLVTKDDKWFDHIRIQHRTIISAIENHNAELAAQTLREHLIESYESVKKNYPDYIFDKRPILWEAFELAKI
jgi:GntR family transcriptional repressor for pyruvate dehydrogenase complex